MIRRRFAAFAISLGVSLVVAALRYWAPHRLQLLELRAVDSRQEIRGSLPVGRDVVIVAIDEKSVSDLGRWPWARSRTAQLIAELSRLGAASIALDIVFAEPEDPENDATLVEAIRESGKVVLGYFADFAASSERQPAAALSGYNLIRPGFGKSRGELRLPLAPRVVGNIPEIATAARRAGYFNMFPDDDGIFRRVPLGIRYSPEGGPQQILSSLSIEGLRRTQRNALLAISFDQNGVVAVTLGGKPIPVDEEGSLWVNYAGPARTFPHYSAADVLARRVNPENFRDRIILVGTTATGAYDIRATPFDPICPGVEIHANVIEDVLTGRWVVFPPWLLEADLVVLVAVGIVLGVGLMIFKGIGGAVWSALVLGGYLWGSQAIFVRYGVPLSVLYPSLAILSGYSYVGMLHYMSEVREKRRIRNAFNLYLEPSVARMVSEDPSRLRLHGDKQELTVLFADLRDFTTTSEAAEPEALVEFMNEYLGTMSDQVFAHAGLVDKYIGDAIMALWGAPLANPRHAANACEAALDMVAGLEGLEGAWRRLAGNGSAALNLPRLGMGAGINTGPMVVGNIGSSRRFNYTVMGDNVNLASRLESMNKVYGTRILIGENTRAQIGDEFLLREIDSVRVKGKRLPVRVYELLSRSGASQALLPLTTAFAEALAAYKAKDWPSALRLFGEFVERYPHDRPGQLYVERCRRLIATPPGEAWDGVYSAETRIT